MISDPSGIAGTFREAGADLLTIHIETLSDPRPLLREMRTMGAGVGISLNPPTPLSAARAAASICCDLVLVMSVMPGFGGQSFEPIALDKLRQLRTMVWARRAASGRRRHESRNGRAVCRGRRRPVCRRLGVVFAKRLWPVPREMTGLARQYTCKIA